MRSGVLADMSINQQDFQRDSSSGLLFVGGRVPHRNMGQFWVILANQLSYSGEGGTTFFSFLLLYDQSIQSGHWTSITHCSNWFPDPSHEPALSCSWGGGWRVGSPVPPASEAWKQWAMQTQSWSLSGQQGPGWSLAEGPVYSNNSTRPSCLSRGKAPEARIHTQPPSAPYLPSGPGLEGAGKGGKAASDPSLGQLDFRHDSSPGALNFTDTRSLWHFLHSLLELSTLHQDPDQDPSSRKLFQVLSLPVSQPIPVLSPQKGKWVGNEGGEGLEFMQHL